MTTIHGRLGGGFVLEGSGFGFEDPSNTLLISNRPIVTTSWSDSRIKGQFPLDLLPGPVSVNGKIVCQYPSPKPEATT